MADQTIPDYETIRAAVAGETWAVEKVRASGLSQNELDKIIADGIAWAKDQSR